MGTSAELKSFFSCLLHVDTTFVIKKVYQYDTFPGWNLLSYEESLNGNKRFDDEWMEKFEKRIDMFQKNLEKVLQHNNLLDNKIAVVLDFQIPGFRRGTLGTILWCHKDMKNGFFLGCNPSNYVKETNIEFHI